MESPPATTDAPPAAAPPPPPIPVSLVWFRRDLRLEDNAALNEAFQAGGLVIPVFVWAPDEDGQFAPGRCNRWFLQQSLASLESELAARGSRLICRRAASSAAGLLQLVLETGATGIYYNRLYDALSLVRDTSVKQGLPAAAREHGLSCSVHSFNADLLAEPWQVLAPATPEEPAGVPYQTFDAFWAAARALPEPPAMPVAGPTALPAVPVCLLSMPLATLGLLSEPEVSNCAVLGEVWVPGEPSGAQMADRFMGDLVTCFLPVKPDTGMAYSSRLSPHLHFGEISVRRLYHAVAAAGAEQGAADAAEAFLRRLGYREYSRYLSYHQPLSPERAMLAHLRNIQWNYDQSRFKAWRQGLTGYPIVDAGMRQLWATGWMHNRLRVLCAHFLVKYLLLPWQWGLKFFWDVQIDADIEEDVLGWQYISGSLPDSKPFEVLYDMEAEGAKLDPTGRYVRQWIPGLARVPREWVHRPWKAPHSVLEAAGLELGGNYPEPLVRMEEARDTLRQVVAQLLDGAVPEVLLATGCSYGADESTATSTGDVADRHASYHVPAMPSFDAQEVPEWAATAKPARQSLGSGRGTDSELDSAASVALGGAKRQRTRG